MVRNWHAAVVALAFALPAAAQGLKRTALQTVDFPPGYSTISAIADLYPGASTGRHMHPGVETGYVIEGEVTLLVDGQAEQHLKAGDSWQIAAAVPHDGRNTSDKPAKVLVVNVVDKTKPVASLVP